MAKRTEVQERLLNSPEIGLSGEAVSEEEWAFAEAHCQEGKKLDRKEHPEIKHSFFKVNGILYAFDRGKENYLGEGSFGRVKKCITRDGTVYAVKVEGISPEAENVAETEMMTALSRDKGTGERTSKKKKAIAKQAATKTRRYLFQLILPGKELKAPEIMGPNKVEIKDRLLLAREAAIKLNELHQLGFVHRDVKLGNFVHKKNGHYDTIEAVDFGMSCRIGRQLEMAGNPHHVPPECFIPRLKEELSKSDHSPDQLSQLIRPQRFGNITFADVLQAYQSLGEDPKANPSHDVYAFGIMLARDFSFHERDFVQNMVATIPSDRPSMAESIHAMELEFAKETGLHEAYLEDYFNIHDGMKIILPFLQRHENWKKMDADTLDLFFEIDDIINQKDLSQVNFQDLNHKYTTMLAAQPDMQAVIAESENRNIIIVSNELTELYQILNKADEHLDTYLQLLGKRLNGVELCHNLFNIDKMLQEEPAYKGPIPTNLQQGLYKVLCDQAVIHLKLVLPVLTQQATKGFHLSKKPKGPTLTFETILHSQKEPQQKVHELNGLLMELLKDKNPKHEDLTKALKTVLQRLIEYTPKSPSNLNVTKRTL